MKDERLQCVIAQLRELQTQAEAHLREVARARVTAEAMRGGDLTEHDTRALYRVFDRLTQSVRQIHDTYRQTIADLQREFP
jgi:hypothetical protein